MARYSSRTSTPAVTRTAAVADRRATANIAAPAPAKFSGPLIDPNTGASQVAAYAAAQQAAADAANNNGTGGSQVDYGTATLDNPAPAPVADTSIEALTKTPEYMARERALASAMELFQANQDTERARYGEGYKKSLSELGYDPTSAKFDLGELMSSGQQATTSGKAFNALRNDFAARGMLQSGAFQASRSILQNQLEKQRQAIDEANANFSVDQQTKLKAQQQANEQARLTALDEAKQAVLARFAGGA